MGSQQAFYYSHKISSFHSGQGRATMAGMRAAVLVLLATILITTGPLLHADQDLLRAADETNVNQRYVIESVSIPGIEHDLLPDDLRHQVDSLIGLPCDMAALEALSLEIRRQLHFRTVTEHLAKGSEPGRVRVSFEVGRRDQAVEVSLPRFLYHSDQGFSGELEARAHSANETWTVGLVSNGEDLTERFSGIRTHLESAPPFAGPVHFELDFDDYHEQWNSLTVAADSQNQIDLYRSRRDYAPRITFPVSEGAQTVIISLGTSFTETQSETPAIGNRWTNAATLDAFWGHKIEKGSLTQRVDAKYSLRVATRILGSGYAYARHMISFRYEAHSGRHSLASQLIAGSIAGDAPFFDRFVLGSSSTLRGWDRYEIDPLGGSRVVHNEMTYGYRTSIGTVEAFYDTGMLWQSDRAPMLRHSIGAGLRRGIFVISLACPLKDGRVEPVFMAGMNY